jgi:hypothetical protein
MTAIPGDQGGPGVAGAAKSGDQLLGAGSGGQCRDHRRLLCAWVPQLSVIKAGRPCWHSKSSLIKLDAMRGWASLVLKVGRDSWVQAKGGAEARRDARVRVRVRVRASVVLKVEALGGCGQARCSKSAATRGWGQAWC